MKNNQQNKKSIIEEFLSIEKFAKKTLIIVLILTIIFTIIMIGCFIITGQEQSTLITSFYTAVVVEIGVLMAKTIIDAIGDRITYRKSLKENHTNNDENNNDLSNEEFEQLSFDMEDNV